MADYYIDFGAGSTITGTWTFTNGSATVSATGGAALTELVVGDYIRASVGAQWYKITVVTDDNTITVTPVFQQTTVTDTAGATLKNAGTGTNIDPWAHLNQATTDTVRSAGDIIHLQNEQTYTHAGEDIVFDEDGTVDAFITVIGDDWKSLSAAGRPTVDFGSTTEQIYLGGDNYWKWSHVEIINSTNEGIEMGGSAGIYYYDLDIHDNIDGIQVGYAAGGPIIDSCNFYNNTTDNLNFSEFTIIKNSTFNGGAGGTAYGIHTLSCASTVINCEFGQTTAHSNADIYCRRGAQVSCFNCKFTEAKISIAALGDSGGWVKSYDHQQVKDAYWSKFYEGTIEKETTEVRVGGATSSIKVDPNSNCTTNHPLKIAEWNEYAVAASAQTRSVYMECVGIVTVYSDATQLWLEAEYYDAASGTTTTTIIKSTDVLAANSTWVQFSVSFTPGQVGRVIYRVYLGYDEGAEVYYVDNQLN